MILSLKKEVFTFCKAQGSAVFATGCDYAMRLFLDKIVDVNYLYATFVGGVTGGVINCFVNYNFAFHGNTARKRDVIVRYFLMWTGSILLNTAGTGFFKEVARLKVYTAMLLTSFLVALFWNYMLQRTVVFKDFHKKNGEGEDETAGTESGA